MRYLPFISKNGELRSTLNAKLHSLSYSLEISIILVCFSMDES